MLENLIDARVFVEQAGTVIVPVQADGAQVAIIFNAADGRFTLMISDRYQIAAAMLEELLRLGDEIMGVPTLCRYDVSYPSDPKAPSATIFEWRAHSTDADAFLTMMACSNGFVKGGYERMVLLNGHDLTEYRDPALAKRLAARS